MVSGGQRQGRRWRLSNSFSGAPMWTAAGSTPLPPHPHPAPPSHPRCCYPVAGVAASAVRMSIIAFELRVSILHRPSPQLAEVACHPNLGDASPGAGGPRSGPRRRGADGGAAAGPPLLNAGSPLRRPASTGPPLHWPSVATQASPADRDFCQNLRPLHLRIVISGPSQDGWQVMPVAVVLFDVRLHDVLINVIQSLL